MLLYEIIENWQRSDVNPFELADSLAQRRDANGHNQSQIAEATGKSKGEISKILTILDVDPAVQKLAREDASGRITKRHLYSIARLDPARQERVLLRIQERDLTAVDTERMVARMEERNADPADFE